MSDIDVDLNKCRYLQSWEVLALKGDSVWILLARNIVRDRFIAQDVPHSQCFPVLQAVSAMMH